jgi:hypothetical protein
LDDQFVELLTEQDPAKRSGQHDTLEAAIAALTTEKIVNWLRHFKAEDGMPLNVFEEDICPSATLQPVNPAIALFQPSGIPTFRV